MESIENFLSERRTKIEIGEYKEHLVDYLKSNFIPPTTAKKEQFESWFEGYFKNYIFNNRIDFQDKEFQDDLLHKIDYLNSAQAKKRFDRMTWDVLEKQVQDWEDWLKKRAERGDDPKGTELAAQLSDNWSAVELKSDKALSYEGGVMGHCVGSYYSKVKSERAKIFSLRDKKDNSHVTIEYNTGSGEIVQIQGKENKLPKDSYHKYIFEFASINRLMFSSSMMQKFGFKQLGFDYLPPGKEYEEKLQEYLEMGADYTKGGVLDLRGEDCRNKSISGVWDMIRIDGDTNIKGLKNLSSSTIELNNCSENINFDKVETNDLTIKSSLISSLESMDVKRNLTLVGTLIKEIPEYNLKNLQVKGVSHFSVLEKCLANAENLRIHNAPLLKEIKEKNYVNLTLESTGLNSLSGIGSENLTLINCPSIKTIDFNSLKNGSFYNIGIESIEDLELEGKGKLEFSGCGSLEKVSNVKAKNHRIQLNQNPNLKEISGVSVAFLDLKRNVNLENLEKIRAHSANFSDVNFDKVKTRRINLRKISTNNKEIIRTRKLSGFSNR
jgi:hypothetical protein